MMIVKNAVPTIVRENGVDVTALNEADVSWSFNPTSTIENTELI